ncbi:hypothetical protein [Haloarcula sp. JP-L23]|uniref:hypothetical protein n=1 Tax=Haloarcula sp. JP-L23 TaxID=2716717 RepID=UPI00140EC6F0|nr:hypothetical protein G9465_23900 [Haloarcula sp. JP-L23]
MLQNQSRHRRFGRARPDQQRQIVESITAAVRDQHSSDADVEALVLSAIAQQSGSLDTPDVLELRTQLDVAVDEQAPLRQQVQTVLAASASIMARWDRTGREA